MGYFIESSVMIRSSIDKFDRSNLLTNNGTTNYNYELLRQQILTFVWLLFGLSGVGQ